MSSFLSWGYRRLSCLGVVDVFPVIVFSTLQGRYIHTHSSLSLGNRRLAFFDYIATRKTRLSINKHTKSDQNHEEMLELTRRIFQKRKFSKSSRPCSRINLSCNSLYCNNSCRFFCFLGSDKNWQ